MGRSTVPCLVLIALALPVTAAEVPCDSRPSTIRVGPGPEDFDLQRNGPRGPRLIISSQDRRDKKQPGRILLMDLEGDEKERAKPATIEGRGTLSDLHPVGISLVETPEKTRLYVIHSHQRERWIELYDVEGDTLRFIEPPLRHASIRTPNDLVALPNGEIYVSNSGYGLSPFRDVFATLFRVRRGSVVHFDGRASWKTVLAKGLFPNGLAVDPAGRNLFIALFGAKRIRVYDIANQAFRPGDIELEAFPDNLLWEVPGARLNVACHRSQVRTGLHGVTRRIGSPSIGFAIDVLEQGNEVALLYDLPRFNASSTALAYGGRVYVSQLIDPNIAVIPRCSPKPEP